MVQALLAGRKTQTRRIVKPQPEQARCIGAMHGDLAWRLSPARYAVSNHQVPPEFIDTCPYGKPGEKLWVRETWSTDFKDHYPCDRVWYAADDDRKNEIEVRDGVRGIYSPESRAFVPFKWRPSIHMRREFSRILLEITGLRIERVQDATLGDICAEGLAGSIYDFKPASEGLKVWRRLWAAIHGESSWDVNPWVWVVEFKKI